MYPAPIRWLMHGVLTAGRGALFTRTVFFFREENHRALVLCAHRRTQDAGISRGRNARPPHAAAILAAFTGSGNEIVSHLGTLAQNRKKPPQRFPRVAAIRLLTSSGPWCTGFRRLPPPGRLRRNGPCRPLRGLWWRGSDRHQTGPCYRA